MYIYTICGIILLLGLFQAMNSLPQIIFKQLNMNVCI